MNRALTIALLTLGVSMPSLSDTNPADPITPYTASPASPGIKGRVIDKRTGEEIIGAKVYLKENKKVFTLTGLDGSFSLPTSTLEGTLVYHCLGYKQGEFTLSEANADTELSLEIEEQSVSLGEAVVMAHNPGRTEAGARGIERKAMNVVNVMSAKSLELSPDLSVGSALGRMSGIALERSASGEGQYAILRGMDKRYNYTLVNGVKIPSPDNKNRFVPLDLFPSEMLDRLEVTKSLTADLEGDGIGGAVNMMMKDAPDRRQLTASASMGYSSLYFDRRLTSFSAGDIDKKSPNERYGIDHTVTMSDFTLSNLALKHKSFTPDLTLGLSYGDRFFNHRLGLMVAANVQHTNRGKESKIYSKNGTTLADGGLTDRTFSESQTRLGAHLKLDYQAAEEHKLAWYNGYMYMSGLQVRDTKEVKQEATRMRYNRQSIFNSTLIGEHRFLDDNQLSLNWRAVYSKAVNKTPDNAEIFLYHRQDGATNGQRKPRGHSSLGT